MCVCVCVCVCVWRGRVFGQVQSNVSNNISDRSYFIFSLCKVSFNNTQDFLQRLQVKSGRIIPFRQSEGFYCETSLKWTLV